MAFTKTQRSLCNKLVTEYSSLINPVIAAKGQIKQAQLDMKSSLNGMSFSTPSVVQDEANALKQAASDLYPGSTLDDMEALKQMLEECSYLQGLSPVAAILGTTLSIFDNITGLVNSSTIPEFGVASIGSFINDILSGAGIPGGSNISGILGKADKLIECLSSVCGPYNAYYITAATEYATTTNDLYSDLNVVSDPNDPNYGKFDYESVYNDIGMDLQQKTNMNNALNGVTDMKIGAIDAINNSVESVKSLSKTGFF
jgi:hypothetical protein